MLRRKPTAINLTSEDLASYEDRQAREALAQAEAAAIAHANIQRAQMTAMNRGEQGQNKDPNSELTPNRAEDSKVKNRAERIGLAGRS